MENQSLADRATRPNESGITLLPAWPDLPHMMQESPKCQLCLQVFPAVMYTGSNSGDGQYLHIVCFSCLTAKRVQLPFPNFEIPVQAGDDMGMGMTYKDSVPFSSRLYHIIEFSSAERYYFASSVPSNVMVTKPSFSTSGKTVACAFSSLRSVLPS